MTTTIEDRVFTADDLSKLPDAVAYELVDGKLLERQMGAESSEVAIAIATLLFLFLRERRLGRVFGSDTSYQCFANDPNRVRRADVGFVRFERLPDGRAPKGNIEVSPDLAVEVISPNDTAEEVEETVNDWLSAGVPLVWVVSPTFRTVRIHRPRSSALGPIAELTETDNIDGEDVLPGFSSPVRAFFE